MLKETDIEFRDWLESKPEDELLVLEAAVEFVRLRIS